MVLNSALDTRIIASNPLTGLRLPMTSSRTRYALTAEHVEAIAETVDPWWRPFVLVLAYRGLRPGESVALRRRDLDDLGRLIVERGISEHRGRLIEQDTKTHRARVVQVSASGLKDLREHLEANVGTDPSPIFTTPARTRVRMSNWRHKVWEPAALELDLPSWSTPYVLRHTAAGVMAQQGAPVSAAAALGARSGHIPSHVRPSVPRRSAWRGRCDGRRTSVGPRGRGDTANGPDTARGFRGDESSCGISVRNLTLSSGTLVEAMGLEPTNLLTASQALYQLSYAPSGGRQR
jgi:Phage integrase family